MFAGVVLQATASAQPAFVVGTSHISTFAQETTNNTTVPGAGEVGVAIGGIIVFVAIMAFVILSTIRKRKKSGRE